MTDKFNPDDPHNNQPVLFSKIKFEDASAAMILIHGRGASAESIFTLTGELENKDQIIFAAPQAYGNTWYPFSFLTPREKNEPGLSSGLSVIKDLVDLFVLRGLPKEKIILLGFSQGACLTLEYAAQNAGRYGGIIGLSGGLIGERIDRSLYKGNFSNTPVFLGCSDIDPHIPLERVNESEEIFIEMGAKVTKRIYPNMGHTISPDELSYVNKITNEVLEN